MSDVDTEFERLMRSQALGALQSAEERRLRELAGAAPARAHRLASQDEVLRALDQERTLRAEVARPGEPREEADEKMQRLTRMAADSEQELRARLLHGARAPVAVPPAASVWRRRAGFACLAAAAAVLLWFGVGYGAGPDPRPPEDLRSGAPLQLVLFNPTLTAEARAITWAAVPGASGYDVEILDRDGEVVLRRGDELQKSTAWELTLDEYHALLPRRPLRLRVTALDGVGISIGSSGDLELVLR